jgi:hypothetical protein
VLAGQGTLGPLGLAAQLLQRARVAADIHLRGGGSGGGGGLESGAGGRAGTSWLLAGLCGFLRGTAAWCK